jgi:AraC-like DNA-binding protein
MSEPLFKAARDYAEANVDAAGIALTLVPGLAIIRATAPSDLLHAISRPLICLVLQGGKQVAMGVSTFAFSAGDSLLITADVPTISQITKASPTAPYLSLVIELDLAVIAELAGEMDGHMAVDIAPIIVSPTDGEVADAVLRLMRMIERPSSMPILAKQLVRELHYWLLAGQHGAAIRHLGWPEGQAQRIARSVAVLRSKFAQPLPVEQLASHAGMSLSTFHQHFRAVTSLSPLQFQKQLRLIEARRLMSSDGASPSNAAFEVGYESVSQFTREYGRMFGSPPARDTAMTREKMRTAA